ncbi:hypothetical protein BCR43DRAFT_236508 [Syncephalastrum racemosum]|uniref:Uncharacterized protein n=1 Tax=Syncephalastrum racemosum TaxID=13706 RepID=A0A1X2HEE8_SYNRA|nr:hypothetical protein BCR43DRAFT_236411 [Syncephalastrum racemosum]ORY97339.1 hypothetical protein BCR43DRAFT_236508 [Syncephalastrum racemosum]
MARVLIDTMGIPSAVYGGTHRRIGTLIPFLLLVHTSSDPATTAKLSAPRSLSLSLSLILPSTFLTTRTRLKSSGFQAAVCFKISSLPSFIPSFLCLLAGAACPNTLVFIYFAFEHLPSPRTGRAPVVKIFPCRINIHLARLLTTTRFRF